MSQHLAEWLTLNVGVPQKKIVQIYNGVDTKKFSPVSGARAVIGGKNFASGDSLVVGTVGRMVAVKHPITLVQAFLYLLDTVEDARRRLRLVMIGDGPLRAEAQAMLASADCLDLVWIPGQRDDMAHVYQGFDVFVMPSLNEGISNTILEAMATGLPTVATDVGGNPELVKPGQTGCLVEVGDYRALANGIRHYLEQPALMAVQGANARAAAESNFSLQSMVRRYLEMYGEIIGPQASQTSE